VQWPAAFYDQLAGVDCPFCGDDRPDADDHGVRYWASPTTDAYLVRADIQRGLSVVIWRESHITELTQLTDHQAAAYGRDVLHVGRALEQVFQPVKLNYTVLGNSVPHLHTHVIPRYADDPRPGWPFPFPDPDPPAIPDQRLHRDADLLGQVMRA
jgi:diadenosine tetraphosphate (Ap4A) HIT family hydrolase